MQTQPVIALAKEAAAMVRLGDNADLISFRLFSMHRCIRLVYVGLVY
jgi:hypothetical protein